MANTYSQITMHAVFAVKHRDGLLMPSWRERLFEYIGGTIRGLNETPQAVGGWVDHVHVLFGMKPDSRPSDIVRDIKACSSKWINQ